MVRQIGRRDLLYGLGAVGLVGTATAQASGSRRTATSSSQLESTSPSRDGSRTLDWVGEALWDTTGAATQLPLQVVHPGDSLVTYRTLQRYGAADEFASELVAENSVRLQVPGEGKFSLYSGGFDSQGGDLLGPWVRSTWGGIRLAKAHSMEFDRSAAATCLNRLQRKAGGFGARFSFLGAFPIPADMESTYLALDALQTIDALDPKREALAEKFLKREQQDSGGWAPSQFGSDPKMAGTYDALRALDTIDSLTDEIASSAGSFIRSKQNEDGGFYNETSGYGWFGESSGESRSEGPSTDATEKNTTALTTSRAILALDFIGELDRLGDERLQTHADWLSALQLPEGADWRLAGAFQKWADKDDVTNLSQYTRYALNALDVLESHGASVEADTGRATDYLLRCQNSNTGGVGMTPDYLVDLDPTEAVTRTLTAMDVDVAADRLAWKIGRLQRDDGFIHLFLPVDPSPQPRTKSTGRALITLSNIGRLEAVDTQAAAEYVASLQRKGGYFSYYANSGGFKVPEPDFEATVTSVLGLAAVDELDRIDQRGAAEYFASLQDKTGRIARYASINSLVADTARSLRALEELGRLDLVDVEAATDYLADLPADEGRYWPSPPIAGWAVQGLATGDALDKIDPEATREYLRRNQSGDGGYAGRLFYQIYSSVRQNAAAITGLTMLGGTPKATTSGSSAPVAGTRSFASSDVDTVLHRIPGRGWQRISVDQLPENRGDDDE